MALTHDIDELMTLLKSRFFASYFKKCLENRKVTKSGAPDLTLVAGYPTRFVETITEDQNWS